MIHFCRLEPNSDATPAVVEPIVTDIEAFFHVVRFPDWLTTGPESKGVQKSLRKALLNYKSHADQYQFYRAYAYIIDDGWV